MKDLFFLTFTTGEGRCPTVHVPGFSHDRLKECLFPYTDLFRTRHRYRRHDTCFALLGFICTDSSSDSVARIPSQSIPLDPRVANLSKCRTTLVQRSMASASTGLTNDPTIQGPKANVTRAIYLLEVFVSDLS